MVVTGYFAQVKLLNSINLYIGDKVYTNKNSLVGSIGVISAAANFRKILENQHIDRLTVTTSDKLLERRFDPLKETYGVSEDDKEAL